MLVPLYRHDKPHGRFFDAEAVGEMLLDGWVDSPEKIAPPELPSMRFSRYAEEPEKKPPAHRNRPLTITPEKLVFKGGKKK